MMSHVRDRFNSEQHYPSWCTLVSGFINCTFHQQKCPVLILTLIVHGETDGFVFGRGCNNDLSFTSENNMIKFSVKSGKS